MRRFERGAAPIDRRALLGTALAGVLAAPALAQQGFPTRPLRLIVPFTPGGSTDTPARLAAAEMSRSLGQPVVVENRPGASGAIGIEAAVRSPPDGYTLGLSGLGTTVILPKLRSRLGYAPARDFAFAGYLGAIEFMIVARPGLGARTVEDVVRLARQSPGRLTYGSAGPASSYQLAFEHFKLTTGIDVLEVPFAGDGPIVNELLGGRIDLAVLAAAPALGPSANGSLQVVAACGAERCGAFPHVPTVAESGYPTYEAASWNILVAAAGTPESALARIHAAVVDAIRTPAVLERLTATGLSTRVMSLAEISALVARETEKWSSVIDRIGLRVE